MSKLRAQIPEESETSTLQSLSSFPSGKVLSESYPFFPQHCLNFLPLPQGQGSLRPTFGPVRTGLALATASLASLTMSLAFAGAPEPLWVWVEPKALVSL